jgi:hypothetical protein
LAQIALGRKHGCIRPRTDPAETGLRTAVVAISQRRSRAVSAALDGYLRAGLSGGLHSALLDPAGKDAESGEVLQRLLLSPGHLVLVGGDVPDRQEDTGG